ncbi:MAG: hypothetical protein K5983_06460 [Lactobacillus sp.]|nr:hypothetical protein [Lactobacillus sp.]
MQYQVTDSINAEQEAVKHVTREIEKLKAKKNAEVTAIRSWRFKYQAWKNRIIRGSSNDSNPLFLSIQRYNKLVDQLNSIHLIKDSNVEDYTELLEQVGTSISKIRQVNENLVEKGPIVSDINQAYSVLDNYQNNEKMYKDAQEKYQAYLTQYNEWEKAYDAWKELINQANKKIENMTEIVNDNRWNTSLVTPDLERHTLSINNEGIEEVATEMARQIMSGNKNEVIEDRLWAVIGRPTITTRFVGLETLTSSLTKELQDRLSSWIEDGQDHLNDEKKPVEPAPVYEPEKPAAEQTVIFQPIEISGLIGTQVDEKLVSEMDSYATGKYDNTRGKADEINNLAQKIGKDCPMIADADTKFDNSELLMAVSELRNASEKFGGQRNSSKGLTIINKFKESVEQLENVTNYNDLEYSSVRFSETSTQLFIWLASNWWQMGGTPTGNAHLWHGNGARKLVIKKSKNVSKTN